MNETWYPARYRISKRPDPIMHMESKLGSRLINVKRSQLRSVFFETMRSADPNTSLELFDLFSPWPWVLSSVALFVKSLHEITPTSILIDRVWCNSGGFLLLSKICFISIFVLFFPLVFLFHSFLTLFF